MTYSTVILEIVMAVEAKSYLELGVADGNNFISIADVVERAIGVDLVDHRRAPVGEFHCQSTDEFFDSFHERVDIIFIDADHSFEQVTKDFYNSERCLNERGIIFLHDTDPVDKSYVNPGQCGDAYKILSLLLEKDSHRFDIVTLPIAEAGLTIVTRTGDRRALQFAEPNGR